MIIGHLIPAGTGLRDYQDIEVYKDKYGDIQRDEKQRADEVAQQLFSSMHSASVPYSNSRESDDSSVKATS